MNIIKHTLSIAILMSTLVIAASPVLAAEWTVTRTAVPTKVSQNDLLVTGGDNSVAGTNVTLQGNFFKTIQTYMIGLLGIISVSVFLFIGYSLFTAQGKEEDFKNAWKALTYAVVGLAVIPLSYIVVKIFTGFTL